MNKDSNKSKNILTRKFNLWSPGYIVAGAVYYYGNKFIGTILNKTVLDELVVLTIAIIAGVLYSRVKERIRFIKNSTIRGIVAAVGLIAVSAFLIGGFTTIF